MGSWLDPDTLRDIATPALVIDVAAMTRNIETMARRAERVGLALRPHAKTHKSEIIARMQMRAGAVGIACATVAEADMLAAAGINGLLLTAPAMGADKFAHLARINRQHGVAVVIDHAEQIEGLIACLNPGDPRLPLVVDVDVGQGRTGVTNVAACVRLAQTIAGEPRLQFAGIQGFAGHAQHLADPRERKTVVAQAAQMLRQCADALSDAGLRPAVITGSGTGTYQQDCAGPYNELQVGSYVFMDSDYARIVDEAGEGPSFEPSLFVLATVVSVNRRMQVTVDAGTKALATNGPPPCQIIGVAKGSTYRFAGDEHGIINVPAGCPAPSLGQRLLIGATHCDPTANLHACYHAVTGGAIEIWPIRARHGMNELGLDRQK